LKALFLAVTLLISPLAANAATDAFVAGRDYREITPPPGTASAGVEVREFFWYGCPHCYEFEPVLDAWLRKKPAAVKFVRTPAITERWMPQAQMFYTLQVLGALDKVHDALFRAIQVDRLLEAGELMDEASLADFAAAHGVDRDRFTEAWSSAAVQDDLRRAARLNAAYGIDAVPTLVVADKYVTDPTMAGGTRRCMEVVQYLVTRALHEHKPRRR
jgi:thiol:disulfide interchange protein DsbA